jgi:hypothetical protein
VVYNLWKNEVHFKEAIEDEQDRINLFLVDLLNGTKYKKSIFTDIIEHTLFDDVKVGQKEEDSDEPLIREGTNLSNYVMMKNGEVIDGFKYSGARHSYYYTIANAEEYNSFWKRYKRPPEKNEFMNILERSSKLYSEKYRKDTPKTSKAPKSSTPRVNTDDEETIIVEPQPKGAGRKITVHPTADNSTIGEDRISAGNDDGGLKTWKILLTIVGIVLGVIIAIWLYMGYTIYESQKIESDFTEVSQIDVDESKKYELNETKKETSNSNTVQGNNISEPKHTREKSHKEKGGRIGPYRIVGLYKVIKVEEGEDLATISRRYLGPGMEAFVELYNNIEASDSLTVGQKIRIPKLEWIKE